jgi:hypothetical protein
MKPAGVDGMEPVDVSGILDREHTAAGAYRIVSARVSATSAEGRP